MNDESYTWTPQPNAERRQRNDGTHSIGDGGVLRPEEQAPVLAAVVVGNVEDRRVTDVANDVEGWIGRARDGAEVVRKREDGPVVGHGTEVGVCGVRERAVVDELRADDDVLTGLPGGTLAL